MEDNNCLYTLITGASSGLGKEFAFECARRKMNLILVSLPGEELENISRDIVARYDVRVFFREADLIQKKSIEDMVKWINTNFTVDKVINNAGLGGSNIFADSSPNYLDNIIQLNISATVLLTRLLLPQLLKQPIAYILNVASLAAFTPIPYKTVYPASKAFIFSFSIGLRAELKDTGVSVSVLAPGPILTNTDVSNRINGQSLYVKLSVVTPEKIAQNAIKNLLLGKRVIIPGFFNRFNAFAIRLAPLSLCMRTATGIFKREFQKTQVYENIGYRGNGILGKQSDQKVAG